MPTLLPHRIGKGIQTAPTVLKLLIQQHLSSHNRSQAIRHRRRRETAGYRHAWCNRRFTRHLRCCR